MPDYNDRYKMNEVLMTWVSTMLQDHGFTIDQIDEAMEVWLRAGNRWPALVLDGFHRTTHNAK